MAAPTSLYACKETRVNLDPRKPSSTLTIRLPSYGASAGASRNASKRTTATSISTAEDESQFRNQHLATSASIYHRQHHKLPRSFLWRVLEDGKVLEIRAVDVSWQSGIPHAELILKLCFPTPVKTGRVALADSKQHDVLSVFALTDAHHLYTLSLRPDFFRKTTATEGNVGDWCKIYAPLAFKIRSPLRLIASSPDEVLISKVEGGLLGLEKPAGSDGSNWSETHYSEATFSQNLKSIIPFQGIRNRITYGGMTLDTSAAIAIASSFTILDGVPFVCTVTIDHKLRIWNVGSKKIAYCGDLLDQELEPSEAAKLIIDPSYSQLIKVHVDKNATALCVTYSPLGNGRFKFWEIRTAEDGNVAVTDLFPSIVLEPKLPSADLWTLADFGMVLDRKDINHLTLWTLWKNNTSYRVQQLSFEGGSASRVRDAWSNGWIAMAAETLRDAELPTLLPDDPEDGTDKWLDFILAPGRFTGAVLETGLAIYQSGLGTSKDLPKKEGSLVERLCSAVASTASLSRSSDGNLDYEQFRAATDAQWRRFYRLLAELDKQRGEALSLVIDPQGEMPWVVLVDGITAIRDCSGLEKIWHNPEATTLKVSHAASLVHAASALRDSLSAQFRYRFETLVSAELLEEPSFVPSVRMRSIYDQCDFANLIGEDEFALLQASLGGGFKNINREVYVALIDLMTEFDEPNKKSRDFPTAEFGNKVIVKGVQETIELHRNTCLDQLLVLVLLEAEINHDPEQGVQFDSSKVFEALLEVLKQIELINWLASKQIALPGSPERPESLADSSSSPPKRSVEIVTILEGILGHLLGLDGFKSMSSALTQVVLSICAPRGEYELIPSLTQCFLLKNGQAKLAMEFTTFTESLPFATYIKGRVHLAANDAYTAATLFKKAASGTAIADPKKGDIHVTNGLLNVQEKMLLNAGFPKYYSHIVALFEAQRMYSYVIDFSRLALQFIRPGDSDPEVSILRSEMLSRLFNASVQTSRYDLAHSTLALFTNTAMQHSSLRTLVTKMCESSSASLLSSLPFLGLQDAVDEILAQKCQSIVDVNTGVPYHKILYSWRIKRSDFRGAAAISLERLQRLQQVGDGDLVLGEDGLETPVTRQYVALINALSCVDPKQAWILYDELPNKSTPSMKIVPPKRKIITLADVRKAYQEELDRIAAIENNQFALMGGDEMDMDIL